METPHSGHTHQTQFINDNLLLMLLIHFLCWMQTKRPLLLPVPPPLYGAPSHSHRSILLVCERLLCVCCVIIFLFDTTLLHRSFRGSLHSPHTSLNLCNRGDTQQTWIRSNHFRRFLPRSDDKTVIPAFKMLLYPNPSEVCCIKQRVNIFLFSPPAARRRQWTRKQTFDISR